jgi:integrase
VVVFGHKATLALDRYLRARAAQRRADLPDLWLSTTGRAGHGPMTSSGIYQVLERRGLAADIPGLHPHVLRHTWAHYGRLEGRLHDDEIMRLAGWRSRSCLTVTQRPQPTSGLGKRASAPRSATSSDPNRRWERLSAGDLGGLAIGGPLDWHAVPVPSSARR